MIGTCDKCHRVGELRSTADLTGRMWCLHCKADSGIPAWLLWLLVVAIGGVVVILAAKGKI